MQKELLKIDELARRLGVHVSTLRRVARAGKIPVLRIGHKTQRFDYEAVLQAFSANQPEKKKAKP